MENILERLNLRQLLRVDHFYVVGTTSRCHNAVDANVRGEVLKVACLREIKVEDYLVALVWLQGKVLALYVLGELEGDSALGHLVK